MILHIWIGQCHKAAFPVVMQAEALHIIDQIVARRDGVKELLHAFGACGVIGKISLNHRDKR